MFALDHMTVCPSHQKARVHVGFSTSAHQLRANMPSSQGLVAALGMMVTADPRLEMPAIQVCSRRVLLG